MKTNIYGGFVDDYGNVVFNEDGLTNLLLSGYITDGVLTNIENVGVYNTYSAGKAIKYIEPTEDIKEYHYKRSKDLLIPEKYKKLNIREYVLSLCKTDVERHRINLECDLIDKHMMENFFRSMAYVVDRFRENNIVWGVGRGSSCASYVLYKLGVHKIDCIKYDIDCSEFFKGELE